MRAILLRILLTLAVSCTFAGDPSPEAEISYLLKYVETAEVHFVRSGKEYTPQEGADHLRSKLQKAGSRVKTAEDFIQSIASKSSLTGAEYRLKFPDGKTAATGPWLQQALADYRTRKLRGGSIDAAPQSPPLAPRIKPPRTAPGF